jgi:hypothetical protein
VEQEVADTHYQNGTWPSSSTKFVAYSVGGTPPIYDPFLRVVL